MPQSPSIPRTDRWPAMLPLTIGSASRTRSAPPRRRAHRHDQPAPHSRQHERTRPRAARAGCAARAPSERLPDREVEGDALPGSGLVRPSGSKSRQPVEPHAHVGADGADDRLVAQAAADRVVQLGRGRCGRDGCRSAPPRRPRRRSRPPRSQQPKRRTARTRSSTWRQEHLVAADGQRREPGSPTGSAATAG